MNRNCDHCGASFKAGAPIIEGSDDFVGRVVRKNLLAKAKGARYRWTEGITSARQLITDGTPPEWARAIVKLKVGKSIRIDAGNGEFDLITRVK